MSLEKTKSAVKDFLTTSTPEVLAIKGDWGVGKTYFWNEFIKRASKEKEYLFQHYAYISLFGVSTLEELKFTIFQQVVNRSQIGERVSIDNLKRNAEDLAKKLGRKAIPLLQGLPWLKNYGTAIQAASFLSVKDMLICFDDFERKGDLLSAKDILGLVSLLKEQRNCKVVIIFNDNSLDEKSKEDYKQFREKVIDIEVRYSPTASEAASLVFSDQEEVAQQLKELTKKLNITNIRILRKIEKAAKNILRILDGLESETFQQALNTLTLFGWCYYSHGKEVPSYEYVKNMGGGLYGLGKEKEKSDQEKNWDALLREYGYLNTDELDLALASVIETGYVDNDLLRNEAKKVNDQVIANKSQNSIRDAWNIYHHTFTNNENELVSALTQALKTNARCISPVNLHGIIRLLRELGKNELANELIDVYIKANKEKREIFDLDNHPFSDHITDNELITRFNVVFNELREVRSVKDVLQQIAGKNGWGKSDEEILAAATENDFYEIFKGEEGKHLSSYVDACLQFGRFSNATDQQRQIAQKAINALTRIGSESKLNAIRVKRYGIILDKGKARS